MAKGKELETIVKLAGSVDASFSKTMKDVQEKIGGIDKRALVAAAAVGGIAIATGKAAIKAGKYLKDLGSKFDNATDAIRIGTGATGKALEGLVKDFDNVYKSVPTSMENASQAIADYNTRLGLTGDDLSNLSKQAIQASDMLGEDLGSTIEKSSQAFQQWNVDSDDMGDAMDYVFKVSQSTGMGFNSLFENLQRYGPQLQDMGYTFEQSAALMGQLEKAGVNTDEVLAAMKKSVTTLAKEGKSASDGMQEYYEKIQNAGSAAEAASIASEVFGTRAGSTMAAAIRNGTLSADDLTNSLLESGETISGAAEDTYDFSERLQILKQNLEVALKPIANTVFDGLNKAIPVVQRALEIVAPIITQAAEAAAPLIENLFVTGADALERFLPLISGLIQNVLPVVNSIIEAVLPTIITLMSMILPQIAELVNAMLPVLVNLMATLKPILQPIMSILTNIIQTILPPAISFIKNLLPLISGVLTVLQPIAAILGRIVEFVGKIMSFGAGKIGDFLSAGASLFSKFKGALGFATGGFTNGLSIAGEDPRYPTEAVISFNPAYRSQNLSYWAKAGRMLGADSYLLSGGGSSSTNVSLGGVTFAPVISGGASDSGDVVKALRAEYPEFLDLLEKWLEERGGFAYA